MAEWAGFMLQNAPKGASRRSVTSARAVEAISRRRAALDMAHSNPLAGGRVAGGKRFLRRLVNGRVAHSGDLCFGTKPIFDI